MPRHWHARVLALLSLGGLAVHQLRFVLAYRGGAEHELARQGHAYLAAATPLIVAGLAVATFAFLRALAAARRGEADSGAERSFAVLWPAVSGALAVAFAVQEWLEGVLAAGHPTGLAGVVGHGGWVAIPLALAVGAIIALLLRGADAAIRRAATASRPTFRPATPRSLRPRRAHVGAARDGLERHLAGRAPPLPSH
jgi:hypothetical protein